MSISVKLDQGDVLKLKAMLSSIKNGADRAIVNGINKTLVPVQTQAVKEIGKVLNLKAARIKEDFFKVKAYPTKPYGSVVAIGRPVGLYNFGARQLKTGYSVRIFKAGPTEKFRHAFKGTVRSKRGNDSVHLFIRQQQKGVKYGKKTDPRLVYGAMPKQYRLPVKRLEGPRIEDIYARDAIYNTVQVFAADTLGINVGKEADRLLVRYG